MNSTVRVLLVLGWFVALAPSGRAGEIVELGSHGSTNGHGLLPLATCVEEGKPGVLFGMVLRPKEVKLSYVVVVKCKNDRNTKVEAVKGESSVNQGPKATAWSESGGVTIGGAAVSVKYEATLDTETGEVGGEKIHFAGNRLDLSKGRILLVDLTGEKVTWRQETAELPTYLPDPTKSPKNAKVGISQIAVQIVRDLAIKSDAVAAHAPDPGDGTRRGYMAFLKQEGYVGQVTAYANVRFLREGKTYILLVHDGDPKYFCLIFPSFWEFAETDTVKVLRALDHTNGRVKAARVYTEEMAVSASVDLIMESPDQYKGVFNRAIALLDTAADRFAQRMKEK